MKINEAYIPKNDDKLVEISIVQIVEIIDSLYMPYMVCMSKTELPKFINSHNETGFNNIEFSGRLIKIKDSKALFEPKPSEWDKIKDFDKIKKIESKLFDLKAKQNEIKKIEIKDRDKKIQEIITLFDEVFYNKTTSTISKDKPQQKPIENSLECDLILSEIIALLPYFQYFFECNENQIINFLSENITTQLQIKKNIQIKEVIYFLDWLRDEKRYIKTKKLGTIIENSKCILLSDGNFLTSQKIADGRQTYKNKYVKEETEYLLYH